MVGIPHRYLTRDLPGIGGTLKEDIEDFFVEEVPLYTPCGSGEHTYFEIEKRDVTTPEALQRLSRQLRRDVRDFGFAGLKDRKAVSRQTFSISGVPPETIEALEIPQITVLWARRHLNKLRVGHLQGNRFRIRARHVREDAAERLEPILLRIRRHGFPNYFGPQRFGVRGDSQWIGRALLRRDDRAAVRRILGCPAETERNPEVVRGRFCFEQYRWSEALETFPPWYREERRLLRYLLTAGENYSGARKRLRPDVVKLYFTAYQSYLFNLCLEKRLEQTGLELSALFTGDIAVLHRNGACFRVEEPDALAERVAIFEISPSGPIFGKRMLLPDGPQADIERDVLQGQDLVHSEFHQIGPRFHLQGGRRTLRAQVEKLEWRLEDRDLFLEFFLRKGSYATTFLRELMKNDEPAPGFLHPK